MTAQVGETIIYKGERTSMATEPLEEYLKTREDISFESYTTACWRGYFGTWEIKQNKLYLIKLRAFVKMNEKVKEVGLDHLFPEQNEVFASWFSGEIRLPQGEMLNYIHGGVSFNI